MAKLDAIHDDRLMSAVTNLRNAVRLASRKQRVDESVCLQLTELRDALNRNMERVFKCDWENIEHVGSENVGDLYAQTALLIEPPHMRRRTPQTRAGHFGSATNSDRAVFHEYSDRMRPLP